MKYTIEGFSQNELLRLGLDSADALIIRWFADFIHTGKMAKCENNGKIYYWLNYESLINDLPILGIASSDAMARRLRHIVESGIMEHFTLKKGGTFSYFRLNEDKFSILCTTEMSDSPTQKTDPSDPNVGPPSDPNVGTNNSSTKVYPSTRDKRGGAKAPPTRDEVHTFFDQERFRQDPDDFFDYWESMDWTRKNGRRIVKWQNAARNYVKKPWAPMAPPKPRKKEYCKKCGKELFDGGCRNLECPECPLYEEK